MADPVIVESSLTGLGPNKNLCVIICVSVIVRSNSEWVITGNCRGAQTYLEAP